MVLDLLFIIVLLLNELIVTDDALLLGKALIVLLGDPYP